MSLIYRSHPPDDGAGLTNAMSGAGSIGVLVLGALSTTTPIAIPSSASIDFDPGSSINAAVPTGSDFTDIPIYTPITRTLKTTLSANVVPGSSTLHVVSAAFSVGDWISIYRGDAASSYKVMGVTGSTLTTDRPVRAAYQSGDDVFALTPTQGVTVNFGGAAVSALGGHRALWTPCNIDCIYKNGTFNCSTTEFGIDIDLSSLRAKFENMHAVFVANTSSGITVEGGCEDCVLGQCTATGGFQTGYQISGFGTALLNCVATGSVVYSLTLCESGAADLFAAYQCRVAGGRFAGAQYGVQIRSNSSQNVLTDVVIEDASSSGVLIATGTATAVTTGASDNVLRDVVVQRCPVGVTVGDSSSGAHDNALFGCSVLGFSSAGYLVQSDATGTALRDCLAQGGTSTSGYGYSISGLATLSGCRSENGQGRGLYVAGTAYVTNYSSVNDGSTGAGLDAVRIDGTGRLVLNGGYLAQAGSAEWNGIFNNSTGVQTINNVDIALTGSNCVGVYSVAAGEMVLTGVRITDVGSSNFGLYVVAGTVRIMPGCSFDACAVPITIASGVVTMVQTGGVAAVSATGSLSFANHYCTAIELAASASADSTITTQPMRGSQWVARNLSSHNLIVKTATSGDTGVTIAAGKSAIVGVRASDAKMVRVTPDT